MKNQDFKLATEVETAFNEGKQLVAELFKREYNVIGVPRQSRNSDTVLIRVEGRVRDCICRVSRIHIKQ